MGVLLERARQVFGGAPIELPPPQPFDIACTCGAHLTGFRRDYRQFVPCPGCGQLRLVLPLSPYPKPIVYEAPERSPGDAAERIPARKRPIGVRIRIRVRRARRGTTALLWALVPPKRWFSPVRLLVMGMVSMIAGTGWLTVYLTRRGGLTGDIVAARAAWTKQIEQGDFATAQSTLEQAAAAINRYGYESRELSEVEQLAKEVALFADLLERPLSEICDAVRNMSRQECTEYFRQQLQQPSLILDAYVSPTPTTGLGPSTYRIDSKLLIGGDPARIDVNDLELFKTLSPGISTRVLFGARIQSIERLTQAEEWIVHLVPESGALITSDVCLDKIGWPVDDRTRALLESQLTRAVEQP